MNVSKATAADVGINFRGADVGVTEQFLDDAQVRAVFQQVRGETVSKHVWRDVASHAPLGHAIFNAFPHRDGGEPRSSRRKKYIRWRTGLHQFVTAIFIIGQITIQCADRFRPDGHDAFLVAFADDVDESGVEMQLLQSQIFQLR